MRLTILITILLALSGSVNIRAAAATSGVTDVAQIPALSSIPTAKAADARLLPAPASLIEPKTVTPSVYMFPYSWRRTCTPNWHRMWVNTAVLTGAFVSTLFVLELLPEDATAWNRREIESKPFYKRWADNIFRLNPEIDHDNLVFNYILHSYAGAAYFMSARSCGFNFFQSMLYSALISTIGWEFGIEACMERPSYQDLFITPVLGSLFGEGFYRLKRLLVNNNYEIFGSQILGHIVAFFLDPVNEVVGALSPGTCRSIGPGCLTSQPLLIPSPGVGSSSAIGFTISATF